MSEHTIETVSKKYKELKNCVNYLKILGIYAPENQIIGYYLMHLIGTKLVDFFKSNDDCKDVKDVLMQVLTFNRKQKAGLGADLDDPAKIQQKVEVFVLQEYQELDGFLENKGATDSNHIEQCLNVSYLIDILLVFNPEGLPEYWSIKKRDMKKWVLKIDQKLKNNLVKGVTNKEPVFISPELNNINVEAVCTNKEADFIKKVQTMMSDGKSREIKEIIDQNSVFSIKYEDGLNQIPESSQDSDLYKKNIPKFFKMSTFLKNEVKSVESQLKDGDLGNAYLKQSGVRSSMQNALK